MLKSHAPNLAPRLLTKTQAAAYCGVCISVFDQACPVQPTLLLDRISRYDRFALDKWIDGLGGGTAEEANLLTVWKNGGDHNSLARA